MNGSKIVCCKTITRERNISPINTNDFGSDKPIACQKWNFPRSCAATTKITAITTVSKLFRNKPYPLCGRENKKTNYEVRESYAEAVTPVVTTFALSAFGFLNWFSSFVSVVVSMIVLPSNLTPSSTVKDGV